MCKGKASTPLPKRLLALSLWCLGEAGSAVQRHDACACALATTH